jgi:dTDP-4-amino-4,6-dideoxygalactose transaminase
METVRDEVMIPGLKYNLTDLQAALGIHQLARLDGFIERRAQLVALYSEALADVAEVSTRAPAEGTNRHAWHLFVITLELERLRCDRERFVEMLSDRGIGTGIHFTAVHLHRYYRERYAHHPGDLPETEWASERVISLPLYPDMGEADVARVCEAIREIVQEVRR